MNKPQKSQRLMSYQEFMAGKALKRTFLAGFRKYIKTKYGKEYMTADNWAKALSEYENR